VDDKGYFVFTKHAIVTFVLEGFPKNSDGLVTTRIDHFSHQNVLSSVAIAKVAGGYTLTLDGCFGVDGTLCCEKLSVNLRPGIPKGSIYEPGED
jgi:hypothetical protein